MLTVIVGAFVLIAGIIGLVSYSGDGSGFDFGFDLSGLKEPTGNLLKGMFHSSTETVQFSARLLSLEHQNLEFKFRKPVESIELNYTIPNPPIIVNGMPFTSEINYVVIDEFIGNVVISDKTTIDGDVSGLFFNDVDIRPNVQIPVVIENVSVDNLAISGISGKSFNLKDVYGVINVSAQSGNLVYQKNMGDMDIRSFEGNLWIDNGVIYIEGTGILKADVLNSPGI